jgi:hypothetical protein
MLADGFVLIEAVGEGGAWAQKVGVTGGGGRLVVETDVVVGPEEVYLSILFHVNKRTSADVDVVKGNVLTLQVLVTMFHADILP